MTDDPAMTDDAAMTKAGAEPVRVAAIQAEAAPGDVAANVATAARLVARAASDGARIVVLSELFLSAYDLTLLGRSTTVDVSADADRAVEDARLDPLRVAASEHGTVVVVGAPVRHADGRRTCSALLVDRAGTTTVAYDKQQLCGPDEKALFVRGDVGVTVAVDGWRFAIGICHDGCFPEHGRAAALGGAEAYLVPSAYLLGSEHRRDIYYAARALNNSMYVVFANAVGGAQPWRFNGGSAIYDPEGRAMRKAPDDGERIVIGDLDPAEVLRMRAEHEMLADCRIDLSNRVSITIA